MLAASKLEDRGQVVLALMALTLLLPPPCSSQTFSLNGYVVDAVTGRPMAGTRLHLFRAQDDNYYLVLRGRVAEPKIAGADGHFTFTGLAAHPYSLQAELPHEIAVYGETEDPVLGLGSHLYLLRDRRVEVGPKSEGRTVIFRIAPQAV